MLLNAKSGGQSYRPTSFFGNMSAQMYDVHPIVNISVLTKVVIEWLSLSFSELTNSKKIKTQTMNDTQ